MKLKHFDGINFKSLMKSGIMEIFQHPPYLPIIAQQRKSNNPLTTLTKEKNMQAIITKFLPATNTRSSRIKASCARGSAIVPYPHELTGDKCHIFAADYLIGSFAEGTGFRTRLVCENESFNFYGATQQDADKQATRIEKLLNEYNALCKVAKCAAAMQRGEDGDTLTPLENALAELTAIRNQKSV